MPDAASRIRASIEALPERQRVQWDYQIRSLHMNGTSDGRIAPITGGPAIAHIPTGHTGAYIALMAPHVGEKVAALLEAEALCRETQDALDAMPDDTDEWVTSNAAVIAARARIARADAFDDLMAAIEGEQR